METLNLTQNNQVFAFREFQSSLKTLQSAELSIQTREGDLVNISLNNYQDFSKTGKVFTSEGGATLEFSSVAMSASKYSLTIQGDLNKEELDAIKLLVHKISGIANQFFSREDINPLEIGVMLSNSSNVIQKLGLEIKKSAFQTFSSIESTNLKMEESLSNAPSGSFAFPEQNSIRDVMALVSSTADTVFRTVAEKFEESKPIPPSLSDLISNILDLLKEFMNSENNFFVEALPLTEETSLEP